jgi:hypothetical protein
MAISLAFLVTTLSLAGLIVHRMLAGGSTLLLACLSQTFLSVLSSYDGPFTTVMMVILVFISHIDPFVWGFAALLFLLQVLQRPNKGTQIAHEE